MYTNFKVSGDGFSNYFKHFKIKEKLQVNTFN